MWSPDGKYIYVYYRADPKLNLFQMLSCLRYYIIGAKIIRVSDGKVFDLDISPYGCITYWSD
ncbi:MAG: hypothetical protein B7C24_17535 [Bacteroidetes bacterium 4572_77]|nr:MAG: hypothetical protein B7C24_17535 [Bacteroidetes bacterium 4572_77]